MVPTRYGPAPSAAPGPGQSEPRAFPKRAVLILCLGMLVNSYTLSSLFPYVGVMVKDLLDLETINEAGYYAGYVASALSCGRFLSAYVWGNLIDSFGRKTVMIVSLLSMVIWSLSFGLSTTYAWALSSRLIFGLTNGVVVALRTTLHEVCGPEHVVQGMTYLNSYKAVSLVIGPGVGGLLAQPALHYPNSFAGTGLFGRYPYLLPNLVGAAFALFTLVLVVLYLPETNGYHAAAMERAACLQLSSGTNGTITATTGTDVKPEGQLSTSLPIATAAQRKAENYQPLTASTNGDVDSNAGKTKNGGGGGGSGSVDDDRVDEESTSSVSETGGENQEEEEQTPGILARDGVLAAPYVKAVLFLGCAVQALEIGFEEAYPLFALSDVDVGGLGWNTLKIGKVLLVTGLAVTVFQLFVFPPLIKMMSIETWQRLGWAVGVPAFLAVPAGTMLSWNYPSLFAAAVMSNTFVYLCLESLTLVLTIASTTLVSSKMRGKLSGLFSMAESCGRLLGPTSFSVGYAWSISPSTHEAYGWANHHFVFYVAAIFMALCGVLAWPTLTANNLMLREEEEEDHRDATIGDESSSGGLGSMGSCSSPSSSIGGSSTGTRTQEGGVDLDYSFVSATDIARRGTDMV